MTPTQIDTVWFCPACLKVWGYADPPVRGKDAIPWICDCKTHNAIRSLDSTTARQMGIVR